MDILDPDGSGSAPPQVARRYLHGPAIDLVLAQENESVTGSTDVLWLATEHVCP
jgi:hypothetical protein